MGSWNLFLESSPGDPVAKFRQQVMMPWATCEWQGYCTQKQEVFKNIWGAGSWPMRSVGHKENNCDVSTHRTTPRLPREWPGKRELTSRDMGIQLSFELAIEPSRRYETLAIWDPFVLNLGRCMEGELSFPCSGNESMSLFVILLDGGPVDFLHFYPHTGAQN